MEFSKDKTVAMQQVIAMLTENRDEVANAGKDFGLRGGWVCCFENDFLPFRRNDKGVISAFGGRLFVANSAHHADQVERELNAKVKPGGNRVIVLPLAAWSTKRVEVIENLIAAWKQQSAEQGITL